MFIYLSNPSAWPESNIRSVFKVWNSEFFFYIGSYTKVKELNLPYYLPIAGERIVVFLPLSRVLCEMQTALSRFWIQFTGSISYSDNHYYASLVFAGRRCHFFFMNKSGVVVKRFTYYPLLLLHMYLKMMHILKWWKKKHKTRKYLKKNKKHFTWLYCECFNNCFIALGNK